MSITDASGGVVVCVVVGIGSFGVLWCGVVFEGVLTGRDAIGLIGTRNTLSWWVV